MNAVAPEKVEKMKTRLLLVSLAFTCLLASAIADCNLSGKAAKTVQFPDIKKYVGDSYVVGVEYSNPVGRQTDYYTEYYEVLDKKGRIESHIGGVSRVYIYRAEHMEAWTLADGKCTLQNLTITPDFFKDDQTDWRHFTAGAITTVGPSAMLKTAYDVWANQPNDKRTMEYMGKASQPIRGETAIFWRRCMNVNDNEIEVNYYFADQNQENPFDTDQFDKVVTPLRVEFKGQKSDLSTQYYDFATFQHFIPAGVEPFQLPKGKSCSRDVGVKGPALPDFSKGDLYMGAEVVYRKFKTGSKIPDSTYYSTLTFALDKRINHLAYYYSSWNTSKPTKDQDLPFVNAPAYNIYDLTHQFLYNISYETGKCEISNKKGFSAMYKFPEDGTMLDLSNPYVLLTNDKMEFLSSGTERGLPVNIYEVEVKGFVLNSETLVPRAIVTHTYLKENEKLEGEAEVAKALTQVELRLYRTDEVEEIVTFNLFGFSTRLPKKQVLFDITRCFKNDDDYSILTLGFEVEQKYLKEITKKLPQIEQNVLSAITRESELNAVRIPTIMSTLKKNFVYVTMIVLNRPPFVLDFPDVVTDTTIKSPADTQGISDFNICAQKCLEEQTNCWGFSQCGATCYFGSETSKATVKKNSCSLYKRNTTVAALQSKGKLISNIVRLVEAGEIFAVVTLDTAGMVTLVASVVQVDDPAEGDDLFVNMGNMLNKRMRVFKAASKLKKSSVVKNLGRLRYDECQTECLDYKDCETLSYCIEDLQCVITDKFGEDLKDDVESDEFCILLTRRFEDHFDRTPGVFVKAGAGITKDLKEMEDCAKACVKEEEFRCLSFDHCAGGNNKGCTLYKTHFLDPKLRETKEEKDPMCGHYTRKYSNDYKRKDNSRLTPTDTKIPVLVSLTLEECAKSCNEYGKGTCYGYDFCQDGNLTSTACLLFDSDPSIWNSTYSPICTNYVKLPDNPAEIEYIETKPYSSGYAGGIGFLCFLIGGLLGAVIVFAIAYYRVNKR